ncbi:MAG: hypothetical protein LBI35_03530 [Burkholderiales bacterium]|jgi:hypothetical protein|nr:hypothetical protein [Burkholderiales bacterium]
MNDSVTSDDRSGSPHAIGRREAFSYYFSRYWKAVFLSVLTVMFGGMRQGGFFLLPLFFFFLLWLLFKIVDILRKKDAMKRVAVAAGLWLGSVAIVMVLHLGYAQTMRQKADDALTNINVFHAEHGRYPKDLQESGFVQEPRPNRDYIAYFYKEGEDAPSLFYRNTFMPFSTDSYDFKTRAWFRLD